MKTAILIVSALLLTSNVFADNKGDTYRCVNSDGSLEFVLEQTSEDYWPSQDECRLHKKIQYDWEAYSYFKAKLNGRKLSGIGCAEDVNFEFRSAQKSEGKSIALWMYMDELEESYLTVNGEEHEVSCKQTYHAPYDYKKDLPPLWNETH